MNLKEYLINEKVNWNKLKSEKIRLSSSIYILQDSILNYLKKIEKITDFPDDNALILFRQEDWNINPYHYENESYWYFTNKGINEAENYVKDFLEKGGVRICKTIKIIS